METLIISAVIIGAISIVGFRISRLARIMNAGEEQRCCDLEQDCTQCCCRGEVRECTGQLL